MIQGNYIGVDATGLAALPNSHTGGAGALSLDNSSGHIVGGSQPGAINVISGNLGAAIAPDNTPNDTIQGNYLGVGYDGTTPLGNGAGITVAGASINLVIKNNIVANSDDVGVSAEDTSKVSILSNSIYNNGNRGILINGNNANTVLDANSGEYVHLNFPDELEFAEKGGNTDLRYKLDVPAGSYRIEFFSNITPDPIYNGEGETYLGSQNVTSNGSAPQVHSYTLTGTSIPNITATATLIDSSSDGFGPTSAFSATADHRADISTNLTLLNPQQVAHGATVNYELKYLNNGLSASDLTDLATPGGPAVFFDFISPELVPANQDGPGPVPDSYFVDSSNHDLTCVWLSNSDAVSSLGINLTTHPGYSVIVCWYTGTETTLASGANITTTLSFTITNESDLQFTNYVFAGVSTDPYDPDRSVINSVLTGNGDLLDSLLDLDGSLNNFASASFSPSAQISSSDSSGAHSLLASTGEAMKPLFVISLILLIGGLSSYNVYSHNKKRDSSWKSN